MTIAPANVEQWRTSMRTACDLLAAVVGTTGMSPAERHEFLQSVFGQYLGGATRDEMVQVAQALAAAGAELSIIAVDLHRRPREPDGAEPELSTVELLNLLESAHAEAALAEDAT